MEHDNCSSEITINHPCGNLSQRGCGEIDEQPKDQNNPELPQQATASACKIANKSAGMNDPRNRTCLNRTYAQLSENADRMSRSSLGPVQKYNVDHGELAQTATRSIQALPYGTP
jgi:hypothetical protein